LTDMKLASIRNCSQQYLLCNTLFLSFISLVTTRVVNAGPITRYVRDYTKLLFLFFWA